MTSLATRQRGSLVAIAAVAVAAVVLIITSGTASAEINATTIAPAFGPIEGGNVVTITGTGFPTTCDEGGKVTVLFDEDEASLQTVITTTTIKVFAPEHAAGVVTVTISDNCSEDVDSVNYTYVDAPEIIGVAPDTAAATSTVRIFGNNFDDGATVKFGATTATVSDWVGEHELEVTVPAGTGTVDVTVTNEDAQTAVLEDGFTYGTASGGALGTIVTGHIPAAGGFGLIVFGGTNAQLLAASGCPMATATFYATNSSGGFVTYIPGSGVAAVNAAWNALFPSGIPAMTALIGKCV